jgi:hypothetical protein
MVRNVLTLVHTRKLQWFLVEKWNSAPPVIRTLTSHQKVNLDWPVVGCAGRPPAAGVRTSRGGDGTSDSKTLPEYSSDPHAMEGAAHCMRVFAGCECGLVLLDTDLCSKEAIYPAKSKSSCRHHSMFSLNLKSKSRAFDFGVSRHLSNHFCAPWRTRQAKRTMALQCMCIVH